ncbi:MAG: hypothetical protein JXM70_05230 [Pirellulales bacterium]|nr:hypothetical protein [Pirellulales bacterium]
MSESETIDEFVERIPKPEEIRQRLSANLREARLLRQILKMAEQREKVAEVSQ